MREKNRIKGKITFLLTALAIGWPCGFIVSAAAYYLSGMKTERMALQFMLVSGLIAFILALVSGFPFMSMTENRIRDGIMPVDTYRREHSMFLIFIPQIAALQLIICAVIVGIRYLFLAAGIAVLLGTVEKEMDLIVGTLMCGLIGGFAVVNMAYYMMKMKSSVMDSELRLRSGAGRQRRQTAGPQESEAEEAEASQPEEAEPAEKKEKVDLGLPEFDVPKVAKVDRAPVFKAPQPKRKVEKETPTEDFDLPKEPRRYASDARTGVLPDMETLGLDFEDLDDLE